ncbi:hypothetical protein ACFLTJ_03275 [Chloroflexota bacterium]
MNKRIKLSLAKAARKQGGAAFVMVLILLLLGGLIIAPLLAFMGTGLQTGQVYEEKTAELYAADAGIEDGIWQVKWDDLESLSDPKAYTPYDFDTVWNFQLDEQLNEEDVSGTIQNVWIPLGFSPPSESVAQQIIEGVGGDPPTLIVTGGVSDTDEYQIKITYYEPPDCDDLEVQEIGIWLPSGFEYVVGSSDFEEDPFDIYYSEPVISNHAGSQAVVWDFSPSVLFTDFSGVNPSDQPEVCTITFQYTSRREGASPEALSWVDTNLNLSGHYEYAWDADTKVYKITSEAGDTELEAYTAKSELRELGGVIAGDYNATGNTMMTATGSGDDSRYREMLFKESSATVETDGDGIPASATVQAAYLYWSGWIDGHDVTSGGCNVVFSDSCSNFGNWDNGDDWSISSGQFRAHHYSWNSENDRYLTMSANLDLSPYAGQMVSIFWDQSEGGGLEDSDRLYFEFSADGNWPGSGLIEAFRNDNPPSSFSYVIPNEYLTSQFKVRFYIQYFSGSSEYCYLDDISICVSDAIFSDSCDNYSNWNNPGSVWDLSSGSFVGHYSVSSDRHLEMQSAIDLSGSAGKAVTVSWDQWENGSLEDTGSYRDALYFAFYDGSSWSSDILAFSGNIGSSPQNFSYTIPNEYLTADFKMRFYLGDANGFVGGDEYAFIDNISIVEGGGSLKYPDDPTAENLATLVSETARVNTVMFNDTEIISSDYQVEPTADATGASDSWSYSCFYDAIDLVQQWIGEESINTNGSGTYTVGHVLEDGPEYYALYDATTQFPTGDTTGYPLASPAVREGSYYPGKYQWTYAGWGLVVIYSSFETKGHQLYLFDEFRYVGLNTQLTFNVGGFLAPDDTAGSHLTYFVGEGDNHYTTDYIKVNGATLSDAINPANNVFNSYSNALDDPYLSGVDIDTFDMSGHIDPGDSSAEIILDNGSEIYDLVFIILSFRSDAISGGTISYLIKK